MTEENVVDLMNSSRSAQEWDANCDTVKRAFGGRYPSYWYHTIILSGLARRVMARFGESPDIEIHTY